MEGYVPYPPHVDADRGEDSYDPVPTDESLVARHAICQRSRPDDRTSALPAWHLRNPVRFSETRIEHFHQRRHARFMAIASRVRGRLLQGHIRKPGVAGHLS